MGSEMCIRDSVWIGGIADDLRLWLMADDGVTAVGSDDKVTDWADQSGQEHDFTQSTGDHRRPEERANAINFNPAIDFNRTGSSDFLVDDDAEDYLEGLTAVSSFVAVDSDSTDNDQFIFSTSNDSEAPWGLRFDALGELSGKSNSLKTGLKLGDDNKLYEACLLYTSPSPRDRTRSRMPSSA